MGYILLHMVKHTTWTSGTTLLSMVSSEFSPNWWFSIRISNPGNIYICAMVKSRYMGDGHPTFNRNPCNGYINPYYWVDDHPLLYGNNGSLDPGTYIN